jgi:hypothetical protein
MILSNPERQDKLNQLAAVVATPRRWTAQEAQAFAHVLADANRHKWTAGSSLLLRKLQVTTWIPKAPEALVETAKGRGIVAPAVTTTIAAAMTDLNRPAMDPDVSDVLRELDKADGKDHK